MDALTLGGEPSEAVAKAAAGMEEADEGGSDLEGDEAEEEGKPRRPRNAGA